MIQLMSHAQYTWSSCGRSIVSLAMYEKGYLCQKDPSHPDPPRKSTQLACIYTEYVYVATLIQLD